MDEDMMLNLAILGELADDAKPYPNLTGCALLVVKDGGGTLHYSIPSKVRLNAKALEILEHAAYEVTTTAGIRKQASDILQAADGSKAWSFLVSHQSELATYLQVFPLFGVDA